jgi:hypothetical protein
MHHRVLQVLFSSLLLFLATFAAHANTNTIRLLVRSDDMGAAQAINEACIASYKNGITRSVEVIVPGPWFLDAVRLLKENPGLDVGVHLCLTSEWERVKWGPLTHAPSLVDENGYFYPMTSQRKDFPPRTGFLQGGFKLEEVEKELRAQIEMARKHLPRISHLSAHMYTAMSTPELRELVLRLAKEYGLKMEMNGVSGLRGFNGKTGQEKVESLKKLVSEAKPGTYLLVEHPGYDTPEMRNLGHLGYYNVAEDRAAVTECFTDKNLQEWLKSRGVELISYRDVQ